MEITVYHLQRCQTEIQNKEIWICSLQLNFLTVHNTLFTSLWFPSDSSVDAKAGASCQGKRCSKSLSEFVVYETDRVSQLKNRN